MDGRFAIGGVVVIAIAYAASSALRNDEDAAASSTGATSLPAQTMQSRPVQLANAPEPERADTPATQDAGDAALLAHVDHKYRFLLADVDSERVEQLRRQLLARESEISLAARERLDAQIGELLPVSSVSYYHALKDSDLEQHHLLEYAGGISNVAPLEQRQERVVLDAKLRQKQRYATALRDLGLERDALSQAERSYAHAQTLQALKRYQDDFLTEVAPALTIEQYTQLQNYETTEFARELARLQQKINAK